MDQLVILGDDRDRRFERLYAIASRCLDFIEGLIGCRHQRGEFRTCFVRDCDADADCRGK